MNEGLVLALITCAVEIAKAVNEEKKDGKKD